jgi:hypothetical protein
MRSNLPFIMDRLRLNMAESGTIVVLNWVTLSGGTLNLVTKAMDGATATARAQVVKGFAHFMNAGSYEVKVFNEVEIGDCILELEPDVVIDGKQDLRFRFAYEVRLATTGNHGLSGLAAIDGVTPAAGDKVLAKDQTTQTQNGIYTAASGAWTRDSDASLIQGLPVFVKAGTVNGSKGFRLLTEDPIVAGTTAVVFESASDVISEVWSPKVLPNKLARSWDVI